MTNEERVRKFRSWRQLSKMYPKAFRIEKYTFGDVHKFYTHRFLQKKFVGFIFFKIPYWELIDKLPLWRLT